jgi:hypothetical protein
MNKLFLKIKIFALIAVFFGLHSKQAVAGDSAHGSEPMKDRFIIARQQAIRVLGSPEATNYFTASQIVQMVLKLLSTDPRTDQNCYERKLCWYNVNSDVMLPPLKAELDGKKIDAILTTTPDKTSPIIIDIGRSKSLNLSQKLAVVTLVHEAGHSIGISDALISDERIIDLLQRFPEIEVSGSVSLPESTSSPLIHPIVDPFIGYYVRYDKTSEVARLTKCPKTLSVAWSQTQVGYNSLLVSSYDLSEGNFIKTGSQSKTPLNFDPLEHGTFRRGNDFYIPIASDFTEYEEHYHVGRTYPLGIEVHDNRTLANAYIESFAIYFEGPLKKRNINWTMSIVINVGGANGWYPKSISEGEGEHPHTRRVDSFSCNYKKTDTNLALQLN